MKRLHSLGTILPFKPIASDGAVVTQPDLGPGKHELRILPGKDAKLKELFKELNKLISDNSRGKNSIKFQEKCHEDDISECCEQVIF